MSIKYKCKYNLKYATNQSAGVDVYSDEDILLKSNIIYKISTSLYLEMPDNIEGQVRSRSSLASKGIIILNAPGTIDADYRGEIFILLYNLMSTDYLINKGDRIAQIIFNQITRPNLVSTNQFTKTERGDGGFGSTGR